MSRHLLALPTLPNLKAHAGEVPDELKTKLSRWGPTGPVPGRAEATSLMSNPLTVLSSYRAPAPLLCKLVRIYPNFPSLLPLRQDTELPVTPPLLEHKHGTPKINRLLPDLHLPSEFTGSAPPLLGNIVMKAIPPSPLS